MPGADTKNFEKRGTEPAVLKGKGGGVSDVFFNKLNVLDMSKIYVTRVCLKHGFLRHHFFMYSYTLNFFTSSNL